MRYMGLDVGDRTIGVAISDPLKITAQGKETIRRQSIKQDIDRLVDLIVEYEVTRVVSGLPINMNGTMGPQGEKTKEFVAKLEKKLTYSDRIKNKVEIVFWDERMTTMGAERMLIQADVSRQKRKDVIDKIAAQMILQSYLDSIEKQI